MVLSKEESDFAATGQAMLALANCGFFTPIYLSSSSNPKSLTSNPLTSLLSSSIEKSSFDAIRRRQYLFQGGDGCVCGKWPASVSCGAIPERLGSGERDEDEETNDLSGKKMSGTSARGRRLLRVREEKRKREYDRIHNYPTWAKILENACRDDEELRAVLGDSVGNPELMRKRVEKRVRTRGRDFRKSKTGSFLAFKVSFRE